MCVCNCASAILTRFSVAAELVLVFRSSAPEHSGKMYYTQAQAQRFNYLIRALTIQWFRCVYLALEAAQRPNPPKRIGG